MAKKKKVHVPCKKTVSMEKGETFKGLKQAYKDAIELKKQDGSLRMRYKIEMYREQKVEAPFSDLEIYDDQVAASEVYNMICNANALLAPGYNEEDVKREVVEIMSEYAEDMLPSGIAAQKKHGRKPERTKIAAVIAGMLRCDNFYGDATYESIAKHLDCGDNYENKMRYMKQGNEKRKEDKRKV